MRKLLALALLPLLGLLGGCNAVLLSPAGDVALQQRNLLIASTGLMLIIILPVMAATLIVAWRYRASNKTATYDPDWDHSTALEVMIWSAPLLIIIALGALTWMGTHLLDPYRPISRVAAGRGVPESTKTLRVQVVALDWKWLFFYPDQGIATVNELAAPVDVPIEFKITSATVMNSFFIPALAGQIYAMAGMETTLHAVINREGDYNGFSANYSGAGFSRMNFTFRGTSPQDFDAWVAKVKASPEKLDQGAYLQLEKPSERERAHYYAGVQDGLYNAILNMCAVPGKMCMSEMMHIDARGGGGKDSEGNAERLRYDGHRSAEGVEQPGATFPASGRPPNTSTPQPQGMMPREAAPDVKGQGSAPGAGQGHNMPGMDHAMPGMSHDAPAPVQLNSK